MKAIYGDTAPAPLRRGAGSPNRERLPTTGLYRVSYTELPLMYDAAVRLARQRDSQAKLVGMQVDAQTIEHAPNNIGALLFTSLFFYSPLDDTVFEYQTIYDDDGQRPVYEKMALQATSLGVYDNYEYVVKDAKQSGIALPDFKEAPALREPWAKTNLIEDSLFTAWDIAGRPQQYQVVLRASSRTPYDFEVGLFPNTEKTIQPGTRQAQLIATGTRYWLSTKN